MSETDEINVSLVMNHRSMSEAEQVLNEVDGNIDRVTIELASYYAMKRLIGLRSVLIVSAFALLLGARYPVLGLDLELGGLLGVGNMFLVMRGNERYLDRKIGKAQRASENIQRLIILATVPVVTTLWSPWWAMGITLIGMFLPLVLYALELQHRYRTGNK